MKNLAVFPSEMLSLVNDLCHFHVFMVQNFMEKRSLQKKIGGFSILIFSFLRVCMFRYFDSYSHRDSTILARTLEQQHHMKLI